MATYSNKYSHIVEILRHRAINQPLQQSYTFLADGETESGTLTYQELDTKARAIAAFLQSQKMTGKNALVVYPYHQGLEFVTAFFGCLYAGVVAVTDNPPRHNKYLTKMQKRVVSAETAIAITTKQLVTQVQQEISQNEDIDPRFKQLQWVATDDIPLSLADDYQEIDINSDTLAFLQFTSGSTGIPKGVMVTHGNIMHNSETIYQAFEHGEQSRGLIWLPLYHDMGLIGGVIQPLYGGFPTVLMSPVSLIQNPLRWLQAISRYQITTSGGPNFAYDLLCQVPPEAREQLDLSSWDLAFSGAEPIRAETLNRFANHFAPCGFRQEAFYPCYGMAETTLIISGGAKKSPPVVKYLDRAALENHQVIPINPEQGGARAVISCGKGWLGDELIIVDNQSLTRCKPHEVGEIWVRGAGVGKGYWHQPEETDRSFRAYLADTGDGPFLRTGDLGFIEDGEVFITGRIKEMMILWGRNHYPQRIEETVQQSHPAFRQNCGAAFSIDVQGEERLVIVQELERSYLRNADINQLIELIINVVAVEHIAEVYAIALLRPSTIPKTSSGKIQRSQCKQKYLEQNLGAIAQWQIDQKEQSSIVEMLR